MTNARRFELYVRWSLYLLLCALPAQVLGIITAADAAPAVVAQTVGLLLLSVVATGFNVAAATWSLDRVMGRSRSFPLWFVIGWALAILALTAALVAFVTEPAALLAIGPFPALCVLVAVAPAQSARRTGVITVVTVVLTGLCVALVSSFVLVSAVWFVILLWGAWSSGWMLRVLRQLQEAHETRSRLDVAEERLRIARDLHDVFGRTLATISVKSELAAELARRGRLDQAADEMAQIRRIANTAGTEVRRVVRGEREVGWADEMEGARALLASAGIRCTVAGDDVPSQHAETLAWVIREGVTNVLRHSKATQVTITTAVEPDEVALTLTNDGAAQGSSSNSSGTGLRSMATRLDAVGGTVDHQRDGNWFVLTASIPIATEVPA